MDSTAKYKEADLIDAILFIEHEGIGKHATVVAKGLNEQFREKTKEAAQDFPNHSWETAEKLLSELLQNEERGAIAFEGRE